MQDELIKTEKAVTMPLIEGFEVLAWLGSGGMSDVFKARQTKFDRIVAIKLMRHQQAFDGAAIQRFVQEGRVASTLKHPNIAATHACGLTQDGRPFLVMEYLQGRTLRDEIQAKTQLPVDDCLRIFKAVSDGLQFAHESGVVHRDIKPANIMLVPEQNGVVVPKIVDFGIAKLMDDTVGAAQKLTQTGAVLGSPQYMSPEQCSGKPVDARSDIYSFGCTMYEAIGGQPPFHADSLLGVMNSQLTETPGAPSVVSKRPLPPGLDEIVLKTLEKDPAARFRTCSELSKALSMISSGDPLVLAGSRKAPPAVRIPQLTVLLLATGSVIALCIGAYYAISGLGHDTGDPVKCVNEGRFVDAATGILKEDLLHKTREQRQALYALAYEVAEMNLDDGSPHQWDKLLAYLERQESDTVAVGYAQLLKVRQDMAHSLNSIDRVAPKFSLRDPKTREEQILRIRELHQLALYNLSLKRHRHEYQQALSDLKEANLLNKSVGDPLFDFAGNLITARLLSESGQPGAYPALAAVASNYPKSIVMTKSSQYMRAQQGLALIESLMACDAEGCVSHLEFEKAWKLYPSVLTKVHWEQMPRRVRAGYYWIQGHHRLVMSDPTALTWLNRCIETHNGEHVPIDQILAFAYLDRASLHLKNKDYDRAIQDVKSAADGYTAGRHVAAGSPYWNPFDTRLEIVKMVATIYEIKPDLVAHLAHANGIDLNKRYGSYVGPFQNPLKYSDDRSRHSYERACFQVVPVLVKIKQFDVAKNWVRLAHTIGERSGDQRLLSRSNEMLQTLSKMSP